MFQIRKISDLTRLCVLPVMILSIFLAFYLYVDMDKIHNKSQELVNSVIPHVLTAQQSAINLVELKSNIEMVATSPDLQRARQSYVAIRNLINNSELRTGERGRDYQENINEILFEVNRLWKLRLQLDELRTTLHSSLHFMDTVMYLVYNDHPELFPEIDRHISNYIDLYKTSAFTRDLRTEHQFYYQMMVERLSAGFDRNVFLQNQASKSDAKPYSDLGSNEEDLAARNPSYKEDKASDHPSFASLSSTLDSIEQNAAEGGSVLADLAAADAGKALQAKLPPTDEAAESAEPTTAEGADTSAKPTSTGSTSARASSVEVEAGATVVERAAAAAEARVNERVAELQHQAQLNRQKINDAIKELMAPSRLADMKLLAIYKQELDRFDPLWELFLRMQQAFAHDLNDVLGKVNDLSHNFTTGEASSLHAEIQYISFLASETQPMVMAVLLFCLIGFSVTIFVLNRYVMRPLKEIAHILTRFRQTQSIEATDYTKFTQQQQLMEIREIVDILPQIFSDYSQFKEQSSKLQTRYQELQVSSKFDDLTKVFNRGSLNMLIKSVANNTPTGFACLMIDIDYFKNLNDTMGHQHGDEVLFVVAQTLLHSIAKKDLVFRYGGEEFCIFLNDINEHNAYNVAERLCNKVKALKLKNEGIPGGMVTISIGLSLVTTMRGQFRIEELIAQADKALYLAKRTGRDRVVSCPAKMVFSSSDDQADDFLDEAIGEAIKEREGANNSVDAAKRAEEQENQPPAPVKEQVVRENIASTESSNPEAATVFVRKDEPKAESKTEPSTTSAESSPESSPEPRLESIPEPRLESIPEPSPEPKAPSSAPQAAAGDQAVKGRVKAHKHQRKLKDRKGTTTPFGAVTTAAFGLTLSDQKVSGTVLGTTMGLTPDKTKDKAKSDSRSPDKPESKAESTAASDTPSAAAPTAEPGAGADKTV